MKANNTYDRLASAMKKLSIAHCALCILALTLLASCQKNQEEIGGGNDRRVAPRFTQAAITRATGSTWEAGDAIGIYMTTGNVSVTFDNIVIDGAKNIRHTVSAAGTTAAFVPATAAQQIYFPIDGSAVDFYAYYPHQADIADGLYKIDVRNQTDPAAIDLMAAKVKGKSQSDANVSFAFKHCLTKLSLTLAPGTGLTAADLAGMTVTVKGMFVTNSYHIGIGDFISVDKSIAADITAKTNAAGTAAEAIVLPTPFSPGNFKLVFRLTNGMEVEWDLPGSTGSGNAVYLLPGKNYQHTLRINRAGVTLVSQNIADWTDGNGPDGEPGIVDNILPPEYSVGNYFPDPNVKFSATGTLLSGTPPIGIVFYIDTPDATGKGESGKIVSLDETQGAWGPAINESLTNSDIASGDCGAIGTQKLIQERQANLNEYPIFKWLHTTKNNGSIAGRWYIPAVNELEQLYAAMSGMRWVASNPKEGEIKDWGVGSVGDILQDEVYLNARKAFNTKFTAPGVGGTEMKVGENYYWASTNLYQQSATALSFEYGVSTNINKANNSGFARAISAFASAQGAVAVTGVSLNKSQATLIYGIPERLVATVFPVNAADKTVLWTSSHDDVATVDANGTVTPVAEGETILTATTRDGGFIATCQVTVIIRVTAITFGKPSVGLNKGETVTLTATVVPDIAPNKDLTWTSADTSVGTVDATGKVKGLKAGHTTITATAQDGSGTKGTCTVTVTDLNMGDGGGVDL